MRIDPYKDWTFEALMLKQPDTVLVLRYRIFERATTIWKRIVDDIVEMPLNRGVSRFELNNEHLIEITAGKSRSPVCNDLGVGIPKVVLLLS